MKRKTLVISLLLLSLVVPKSLNVKAETVQPSGKMFSDVTISNTDFEAIYFLHNVGVVEGYKVPHTSLNEYRPNQTINRAEFLKIIMAGGGQEPNISTTKCFPDVPLDAWYKNYVCAAKEKGWINGYPDHNFHPENQINEAEALKILGNISGWQIETPKNGETWYQPYLKIATTRNILPIKNISTLMNRGDIAELIFKDILVEKMEIATFQEDLVDDLYQEYSIPPIHPDLPPTNPTQETQENPPTQETNETDAAHINISTAQTTITADGKDQTILDVTVIDQNGLPLSSRALIATATTGRDYYQPLAIEESGNGKYKVFFDSILAGNFTLHVVDEKSGSETKQIVKALPGPFDHIEILDMVSPAENSNHHQAIIKVMSKDKNNNIIPYSAAQNDLGAITTLGSVAVTHDNDVFNMTITADEWGVADVSIMDKKNNVILGEQMQLLFFPAVINMPKGIKQENPGIKAPMYIYFPQNEGQLGKYEFDINYDPATLNFVGIEDPNPNDNFDKPTISVDPELGKIHLEQVNNHKQNTNLVDLPIGELLFNTIGTGTGSIFISSLVITDVTGAVQPYIEKFAEKLKGASESVGEFAANLSEGFWRWWYKIKPSKDVCIDAFILPGAHAVEADITTDVQQVNKIFGFLGVNCHCNFYLNVRLNSVTTLTAAQWTAIDTNHNNSLDGMEYDTAVTNHPATGSCTPVFYVPAIDGNALGESWNSPANGTTNGIAMDNSLDNDNRTLAHELSHQLSKAENDDPAHAKSAEQGADDAGNLMNYDHTGDNLTPLQCSNIEKILP